MFVYLFHEMFVRLVAIGAKCHTIRPRRKDGRRIQVGEKVSLRRWEGKPYRSKQVRIRDDSECVRVSTIELDEAGQIKVNDVILDEQQASMLAVADGFHDFNHMLNYWREQLPFTGDLIEWKRITQTSAN